MFRWLIRFHDSQKRIDELERQLMASRELLRKTRQDYHYLVALLRARVAQQRKVDAELKAASDPSDLTDDKLSM